MKQDHLLQSASRIGAMMVSAWRAHDLDRFARLERAMARLSRRIKD